MHEQSVTTTPDVDAAEFRRLFDEHFGPLAGLARLLGSDDPEDTAAEAFARLYRAWTELRDRDAALAYVRTAVVRLSSNRRRHLSVVRRHSRAQPSVMAESAEAAALSRRDDGLADALAALSDARRTAIVLRYYADLSHAHIGAVMSCTASTARAHVHRGLADLRRIWAQGGERQ